MVQFERGAYLQIGAGELQQLVRRTQSDIHKQQHFPRSCIHRTVDNRTLHLLFNLYFILPSLLHRQFIHFMCDESQHQLTT